MAGLLGVRILITGGTGYFGSHLHAELKRNFENVFAIGRSDADLRFPDETREILKSFQPDLLINLAAKVGGIELNRVNNMSQFEDNVRIGLNVLAAAHELQIPSVLNIASNCVYPAGIDSLLRPNLLGTGEFEETNRGFSLAKKLTLDMGLLLEETTAQSVKTVILSNLYGGNSSKALSNKHLVDAAFEKVLRASENKDNTVEILGTGKPIREFTHIEDASNWIKETIKSIDDLPKVMNLGSGQEVKVKDLYESIAQNLEWQGDFIFDESKPDGVFRKTLDSTVAREFFGWRPQITLEKGLGMMIKTLRSGM